MMAEQPPVEEPVTEIERDAHFVCARVVIQCLECGEPTARDFGNDDEQEWDIECKKCTDAAQGIRQITPVAVLIGEEAAAYYDSLEAEPVPVDGSQPFDGQVEHEGTGPLQPDNGDA